MGSYETAIKKFLVIFTEYIKIKDKDSDIRQCCRPRFTKNLKKKHPCLNHHVDEDDCAVLWQNGYTEDQYQLKRNSKNIAHAICVYDVDKHYGIYQGEAVNIPGPSFSPIWTHWEKHVKASRSITKFTFLGGFMVYYLTMYKKGKEISGYKPSASPVNLSKINLESHSKIMESRRKDRLRYNQGRNIDIDINTNTNTNTNTNNTNDDNNSINSEDLRTRDLAGEFDDMLEAEQLSSINEEEAPNNLTENELGRLNIFGQDMGHLPESPDDAEIRQIMTEGLDQLNQSMESLGIDLTDDDEDNNAGTFIMSGSMHFQRKDIIENVAYRGIAKPDPFNITKSYVRPIINNHRYCLN